MPDFYELSDDDFRELGRLTASFSDLEQVLKRMIGFFLDEDPSIGAIVTSKSGFTQILDVFDAIALYRINNPRNELNESDREELRMHLRRAVNLANSSANKRNQLIHSVWFPEHFYDGTKIQKYAKRAKIRLKRGEGLEQQLESFTTDELKSVIDSIKEAHSAVAHLWVIFGRRSLLKGVFFSQT